MPGRRPFTASRSASSRHSVTVARRLILAGLLLVVLVLGSGRRFVPDVPRIGFGPRYELAAVGASVSAGMPIDGLPCVLPVGARMLAHVEIFAQGKTLLLPPGIGVSGGRRDGAEVIGGRCFYPVRTVDPTGVIEVRTDRVYTLGDLFRVWGQPIGPGRLCGFRGEVLAHVNGVVWRGEPGAIPLNLHDLIVVQVGEPRLPARTVFAFRDG